MQPLPSGAEVVTTLPVLPPRPADGNKGMFGRVLVVAGSRGMSGAAVLAAVAALRSGAGLVQLAVPSGVWPVVASANPCYLTAPLPEDAEGRFGGDAVAPALSLAEIADVVALGPGIGRGEALTGFVSTVLDQVQAPLVLDADGLNAIVGHCECLTARKRPAVLTPHPGEFARLLGSDVPTVQSRRQELAVRFAAEHGVVLALKGHGTVVTDGRRVYLNTTGNAGMATGGTGDVLTGVIAALIGQDMEPFAAAQLGVHVHGLAGDLARDDLGEISLIASDLLPYLPRAFRNF